jgi:hypothetical protein
MRVLNSFLSGVFDALLYPFRDLPPIVGLTVISVITAVAMLLVFKATSDQEELADAKRQMHAGIFEIRLFSDDPRAILSAQVEILRHSLRYMRLTLVPMLWMIVPLLLLMVQLQYLYGYRGLEPGNDAIVKVKLKADSAAAVMTGGLGGRLQPTEGGTTTARAPGFSLEAPAGIDVETPLLWIPSLNEAAWRIRARRPGSYRLRIRLGDQEFGKSLQVSNSVVRRSPLRPSDGLFGQMLNPVEPPLPDGPLESIAVSYPEAEVSLLGWETHWLVVFFILTMVAAFALRGPFRVTI